MGKAFQILGVLIMGLVFAGVGCKPAANPPSSPVPAAPQNSPSARPASPNNPPTEQAMEKKSDRMPEVGNKDSQVKPPIAPTKESVAPAPQPAPAIAYKGARLAGTSAPLLDFVQADYDAALQSGKLVVLYFYASWCPLCQKEFPVMQAAFDDLATDKVVGFRVNYNDNATDDDEKALARSFGVAYQHTKVFIKDGQRILKAPDSWEKERYTEEITKALK